MRIAISPDENPGDPGSVAADGTTERSVNVAVAGQLQLALARCGQDAWFDPDITFEERVQQANTDGTQVLVACAHNESTAGLSGTQMVFAPGGAVWGNQGALAANIYSELAQLVIIATPAGEHQVKRWAAGDLVVRTWPHRLPDFVGDIYECAEFDHDTGYVELLFMSDIDGAWWHLPTYAHAAGEAIAQAVCVTYEVPYVPEPGAEPPPPSPARVVAPPRGRPMDSIVFDGQLHVFYSDPAGKLQHLWSGALSPDWANEVLATGLVPGAIVTAATFPDQPQQLHVFAPTAAGKTQHSWYPAPGPSWGSELLPK